MDRDRVLRNHRLAGRRIRARHPDRAGGKQRGHGHSNHQKTRGRAPGRGLPRRASRSPRDRENAFCRTRFGRSAGLRLPASGARRIAVAAVPGGAGYGDPGAAFRAAPGGDRRPRSRRAAGSGRAVPSAAGEDDRARRLCRTHLGGPCRGAGRQHRPGAAAVPRAGRQTADSRVAGTGRRDRRYILSRARRRSAAGAAAARSVSGAVGTANPGAVCSVLHDHPRRSFARQRR